MYDERSYIDIQDLMGILDFTLNTPQKRHIVGGILLSVSLLFGGLALTTLTVRKEEETCKKQSSQGQH